MSPGLPTGGNDGGAILAAMDLGAGPVPAVPAGLLGLVPGSNYPAADGGSGKGVNVQLHALGKIHEQKVRTLMRSVAELKKRLALATAQGKDHRRSALIRAMRTRLREQELVVDVMKEELGIKAGMGKEEVNDWVIRKTVGGPLRFRPKTREELQNELYRLEKKHRLALDKLKARRVGGDVGAGTGRETHNGQPTATRLEEQTGMGINVDEQSGNQPEEQQQQQQQQQQQATTKELMRLSAALEEVDALRVSIRSREAALQAQAEAIDRLQLENRQLRGVQERLERKERRARELKKKNAHLGEQHTALLEEYEAGQEQVHHLKAQLALRKEEAMAEADEYRERSLRQAEEVGVLLKREEELTNALEEEVASRQREQREHHHNNRQAITRAKAAENALQAGEKREKRLRDQNETMVLELQRLSKEASEAAGLRERGREMALEIKRFTKEAEARQGRLDEARERGATVAEALRASQESLEAEKLSNESLTRAAMEAKDLLNERSTLLEAETKRANDVDDARRRLEVMLADEKKKEEDMGIAAAAAAAEAATQIAAAKAAAAAAEATAAAASAKLRIQATAAADEEQGERNDTGVPTNSAHRQSKGGELEREASDREDGKEGKKRRELAESDEIIDEMESELRDQAEQILRLEEQKHALENQLQSATKVVDELRRKNAVLEAQLSAAVAKAAASSVALAPEAEVGTTSSVKRSDNGDGTTAPSTTLVRRLLRASESAEEKERKLLEELAVSKASEKSALDACLKLKLELDDVKASCELQKARVKDLVAEKISTSIQDDTVGEREDDGSSIADGSTNGVVDGDADGDADGTTGNSKP